MDVPHDVLYAARRAAPRRLARPEERLPLGVSLLVIVLLSALLWTAILTPIIWLLRG
jgi:hypothetical protein